MKNGKKLMCMVLTLCMMVSLAAPAFAAGVEEKVTAVVRFAGGADADALCAALEALPGVSVRWTYEALFRGAAIEGSESALAAAAECGGVAAMYRSRLWAQPYAEGDPAGTSNSLDVMRGEDIVYDGDGMVIAVVDSGLYLAHETFQDYGIMENPALSEEDIDAFADDGGTDGRYVSLKIPFAYDYSGNDRSVHTSDVHGTHVSALAVGYSEREDGSAKFRGVAPAAQLLCMKVFPDDADHGANDADILKAMEDAFLLGADVVNLSLGTEGDFLTGSTIGELYQETIAKIRGAGVIVCCAAGNSGNALTDKVGGITLPTTDYTDYGTACVPAAFPGAMAVGAVNSLTREGGGGIVVNGVTAGYAKAVSENEEEVLPDLEELAGQELTYVMVGGLGEKKDYEGLDLDGCVAVVKRGEIYFTEKVNNAAAAGAVACLIYNNESGSILPAVSGTTIPCAIISLEAGTYLEQLAENGRGTLVVEPEHAMVSNGEPLSMMEESSWGATSHLGFSVALCAPGGTILSAIPGGVGTYDYFSGTSMAAPNASGSFAVLMQALKERGVTDRVRRAELAEALLQSTATLVTNTEGTPISPRRQGAGVIDLTAALESQAVIENPLLELGDNQNSALQLSFKVKNLADNTVKFTVDTTLLTEAFGMLDERAYSTLSPIDITKYVKVFGGNNITVQPNSERTVNLTLQLDRALVKTLEEIYLNGFFLEGYVTLQSETGETLHVTFMGYHGDWEAAPVIEPVDFRDVMDTVAQGITDSEELFEKLGVNIQYNLAYLTDGSITAENEILLGENLWGVTASYDDRIAMSTRDSNAHHVLGTQFKIDLFTLRNAAHVIMVVSNRKTGEVYCVDDTAYLPRSRFDKKLGVAVSNGWFAWSGTDSRGNVLPDGTEVIVEFFAWTESDNNMQSLYAAANSNMDRPDSYRWLTSNIGDSVLEWSFPLTLDGSVPEVLAKTNEETGEILLTVAESEFLAYVAVKDSKGKMYTEEICAGEIRGEAHEISIPLPEGEMPTLYVTASDYASNTVGYCVDLSGVADGGETVIRRCPVAMFLDVSADAWYHEAVDLVFENKIMDTDDIRYFSPEEKVSRAAVIDALYRIAGMPNDGEVELPFRDVQRHDWYYDALQWAYQQGVAGGYDETTFAAIAPVSRQQIAVMLYRAAKASGEVEIHDVSVLDGFKDGAEVSGWAREAVAWAVGEGIFSGDNAGKLNPKATASRAQLAQILMNILNEN